MRSCPTRGLGASDSREWRTPALLGQTRPHSYRQRRHAAASGRRNSNLLPQLSPDGNPRASAFRLGLRPYRNDPSAQPAVAGPEPRLRYDLPSSCTEMVLGRQGEDPEPDGARHGGGQAPDGQHDNCLGPAAGGRSSACELHPPLLSALLVVPTEGPGVFGPLRAARRWQRPRPSGPAPLGNGIPRDRKESHDQLERTTNRAQDTGKSRKDPLAASDVSRRQVRPYSARPVRHLPIHAAHAQEGIAAVFAAGYRLERGREVHRRLVRGDDEAIHRRQPSYT